MTTTDLSPDKAPAYVPAAVLNSTLRVEPLTCAIGAEVSNVNLGVASRDSGLMAEIRALLLKHKVLFFRDQDITRAEHVAFAQLFRRARRSSRSGKRPRSSRSGAYLQVTRQAERSLREQLGIRTRPGARSRHSAACCAAWNARMSAVTPCGPIWRSPTRGCRSTSRRRSQACVRATVSKRLLVRPCRSRSAMP